MKTDFSRCALGAGEGARAPSEAGLDFEIKPSPFSTQASSFFLPVLIISAE